MRIRRSVGLVAATALAATSVFVFGTGSASAHVTVSSTSAVQGGYAVLTFRAPTESDTASTTALDVALPTDHPIASVSVQPHPGWSFKVQTTKLDHPVQTDDGSLTTVVSEIHWTADSETTAIHPGEFDQFNISAGPLPKVESLTFKALQTYSDGSVVKWIEVAAPGSTTEPEHPAPTLQLAASSPSGDSAAADTSTADDGPSAVAVVGVVVGAVALVLSVVALLVGVRRRPGSQTGSTS